MIIGLQQHIPPILKPAMGKRGREQRRPFINRPITLPRLLQYIFMSSREARIRGDRRQSPIWSMALISHSENTWVAHIRQVEGIVRLSCRLSSFGKLSKGTSPPRLVYLHEFLRWRDIRFRFPAFMCIAAGKSPHVQGLYGSRCIVYRLASAVEAPRSSFYINQSSWFPFVGIFIWFIWLASAIEVYSSSTDLLDTAFIPSFAQFIISPTGDLHLSLDPPLVTLQKLCIFFSINIPHWSFDITTWFTQAPAWVLGLSRVTMRFQLTSILAGLALPTLSIALPSHSLEERVDGPPELKGKRSFVERNGVKRTIFEHEATGATLDFVTNSGICETTPGVNQYSGYFSVGSERLPIPFPKSYWHAYVGNENMWFWFFEARNNPSTAPLATWFNGGPGCSSMIGLFQVRKLDSLWLPTLTFFKGKRAVPIL